MEIEVRDYRIRHGRMDDWIAGWRAGVVPLREAAGFRILGAWVDREHDRFLWVIGYSGADGFAAANDRYYDSLERATLDPDPADLIEDATKATVERVL
jgi:hypothetical protein